MLKRNREGRGALDDAPTFGVPDVDRSGEMAEAATLYSCPRYRPVSLVFRPGKLREIRANRQQR